MTTTESLKQLIALADKATPGTRSVAPVNKGFIVVFDVHTEDKHICGNASFEDAELSAACSPDVIAEIVTELLAAREFIKRNREADEAILKIERDE